MNEFGEVILDASLKEFNTYKLESKVKYLIYPKKEKIPALIKYLKEKNIKYFVIGDGSNIILANDYYDGVFVSLKKLNHYEIRKNKIVAECGINLNNLISSIYKSGYNSFAQLYGIPGSLGGAIVGNAGANGDEIKNHLISIKFVDDCGNIHEKNIDELKFSYRHSSFKEQNCILLEASLRLENNDEINYNQITKENITKRIKSQPLNYPSAGSVFKNPANNSAGFLIDSCGLKGTIIGGAKISEKHANFIINYHNATFFDIINLITKIKKEVRNKFNVDLELEQKIVKW